MNITGMNYQELLKLKVGDIKHPLSSKEIMHMIKTSNAFWGYDYTAADAGNPGMHAILKSEQHSDGFFISRILLEPDNIRMIIAAQIVRKIFEKITVTEIPDFIVGVPDGATNLGRDIAKILGTNIANMQKIDGKILLTTNIAAKKSVLIIEDFCTRGTGFKETVTAIRDAQPRVRILPYSPVIINRGGLATIEAEGDKFEILPILEQRIQDWDPSDCPLCARGSEAIKPKLTDENWRLITTSQML